MRVTTSVGSIELPEGGEVSRVVVRDSHGNLLVFCIELTDGLVIVSRAGDHDFEWNAQNHKIPMVLQQSQTPQSSGVILG